MNIINNKEKKEIAGMLEIDKDKRHLFLKINFLYLIFRHYASIKNCEIKNISIQTRYNDSFSRWYSTLNWKTIDWIIEKICKVIKLWYNTKQLISTNC